jgi:uncharacterized membrane protein YqjE
MMDKTFESSKGLFDSLTALTKTFVAIAHTRLELLSIDLEEERERFMSLLILSLVALFSLMVGVVLITITLILAFWDSYRLIAIGSLAGIFLVTGSLTCWCIIKKYQSKPRLFLGSLLELVKDQQATDIK